MINLAAKEFEVSEKFTTMTKGYIHFGGLFNKMVKELYEMLYQNEREYIFDSSKFENAYGLHVTSYEEGIKQTVRSYQI